MQIDEELTLKKLEIFLAFMRTGNLARAAAELQTSTVSVHRAIHSLESALRCPLFKHEGRNLTPMESAYVLEERAQKLVQDVLSTVEQTREAAGFSAARFKLGALYSLTVKTVPQLIMGLKIRRSELNIDLILGSNIDLFYKLKNMEVDAILVSLNESVSDPDCEHLALFSDDIFLAARDVHGAFWNAVSNLDLPTAPAINVDPPFHVHADLRLLLGLLNTQQRTVRPLPVSLLKILDVTARLASMKRRVRLLFRWRRSTVMSGSGCLAVFATW